MEPPDVQCVKGPSGIRTYRLSLYETASRFYLVGGDILERQFKILKIDRTSDVHDLNIARDDTIYSKQETNDLLNAVDDGNKPSGGLRLRCNAWGLLGFVRFTGAHYMLLVTKRSQIAVVGGHYLYQVDATDLVPLAAPSSSRLKLDQDEESRFVGILQNLDLSRSFYFSYTYDITHSLQHNIMIEKANLHQGQCTKRQYNSMFVFNSHLLKPALAALQTPFDWCLPIIHGFIDQASKLLEFL